MSKCEMLGLTSEAPVNVVRESEAVVCDASKCETIVQIGVFFDGTGNNLDEDRPRFALSNIAKLSTSYPEQSSLGTARIYIPGLGTSFPRIGELGESTFGGAFGSGGEGRLLIAMCSVIDNIYDIILNERWASSAAINAMCCPSRPSRSGRRLLEEFGLTASLNGTDHSTKCEFFRQQISDLREKLTLRAGPTVKAIVLDIFGFSRGAATARVFCHWIQQVTRGGKIAGIPVRFRFLGLMDTVASVGVWDGATNAIFNRTGGHTDWAIPDHMLILPEVKNCIHMVAMHEIRKNFPLDQVAVGDVMPENCHEFAYPGSHSDVGGGYAPGDLGVAMGHSLEDGDTRKLSQIPLNHMFECAVAAGTPMSKRNAVGKSKLFEISPAVEAVFKKFIQLSPQGKQRLSDWMLPYLIWRWKTREAYASLDHVRNAKGEDLGYLMAGHASFKQDGARLGLFGDLERSMAFVKEARANNHSCWLDSAYQPTEMAAHDRDAWEVWHRVTTAKPNPAELDNFFDKFVHDSMAGFRKKLTEPTGYWRYRRVFRGDNQPLLT